MPELIEAARPKPETPSTVSGALLEACTAKYHSNSIGLSAAYDPGVTYKFATFFQDGTKSMKPYASRVRAYIAELPGTNIFGRPVSDKVYCYYEQQNGALRFLVSILPDAKGRIEIGTLNLTVLKAYAIMAGKDPTRVMLFGAYAG